MEPIIRDLGKVIMTPEGIHDSTKEYDILSMVVDNNTGNGYVSKKQVPANIELNNEEYWKLLFKVINNAAIVPGEGENSGILYNSESEAIGNYSTAIGYKTKANGNNSHAEGQETKAYGVASHTEGQYSQASGIAAHAEGSSQAHKDYSHSEGQSTDCHGVCAHTEGLATACDGNYSHAEGNGGSSGNIEIISFSNNIFTLGSVVGLSPNMILKYDEFYYKILLVDNSANTVTVDKEIVESSWDDATRARFGVAYGIASHVEGRYGIALGTNSHVEGNENIAIGNNSHAEGGANIAKGDYSHVEGLVTTANNESEHAEGSFNASHNGNTSSEKTMHSVGIGTGLNDRKNAHEIMANGDHYIYGIGGYNGNDIINVKSLQEVIRELQNNSGIKSLEIDDTWVNRTLMTDEINLLNNACFIKHNNFTYPIIQADTSCLESIIQSLYNTYSEQGYTRLLINKAWGEYTINFDLSPITLSGCELYFLIQYDDNINTITKLVLYEI